MMSEELNRLEDDVFAAFERACHEHEFEVAEHLLQTLETIAERSGDEYRLEEAYLQLARDAR
jgi:hypothetical protein